MWWENSIFYQIYPLGFCGAPKENDGVVTNRIRKVTDWIEHFKRLNIDAIYFSPIFESDRHGYDTRDYCKIDCRFGTNADFGNVCEALHNNGIKVVLDGVFNHVGRGFWAFKDVLENKWNSRYKDWFYINFDGNSCYNDGFWYEGWEGHYELVKLNLNNDEVVNYLFGCIDSWIDLFKIDGLRLDVAYLLNENFMRRLRAHVNGIKKDFFLAGEILFGDYNRIANDAMLNSCTNYECYKGLYSSFNSMNLFEIAHSLNRQFGYENWALYRGKHFLCFADNHDVTRIASLLNDKNAIYPLYGILFGMNGIPCLYYGSEWGATGVKGHGSDDELRPSFDKPQWNELCDYIAKLAKIHKSSDALVWGGYRNVTITNKQLAFERATDKEQVLVLTNADGSEFSIHLNGFENRKAIDMFTNKEIYLENGNYLLKPYETAYLKMI